MDTRRTRSVIVLILALATLFSGVGGLNAAVFIYKIDSTYSGTAPVGPAPWATATFTDVGANSVKLTMDTSGLQGTGFIGQWYFNFDPTQDVTQLTFSRDSGAPPGTVQVSTGANAFNGVGGGGRYDIEFSFPTANSPNNRFSPGASIDYIITSQSGNLNAGMFNFLSSPQGGNGLWYTSAHIQNTGSDFTQSAFVGSSNNGVPVPEPATYVILGALLVFAVALKKYLKA